MERALAAELRDDVERVRLGPDESEGALAGLSPEDDDLARDRHSIVEGIAGRIAVFHHGGPLDDDRLADREIVRSRGWRTGIGRDQRRLRGSDRQRHGLRVGRPAIRGRTGTGAHDKEYGGVMAFRNEQFEKSVSCRAMSDLKTIIESHAAQFAHAIIASLKDLSIDDIVRLSKGQGGAPAARVAAAPSPKAAPVVKAAPVAKAKAAPKAKAVVAKVVAKAAPAPKGKAKKTATGRLARRSLSDIDATLDQIVALLRKTPGLRSEQIGAALGLDKKEIPRPVMEGLDRGVLSKAGERRGTTYFVEKKR